MIEFKSVSIKYIKEYYSLFDSNITIDNNTLFVGEVDSGIFAIFRLLCKFDKKYLGQILIDDQDIKNLKDRDLNLTFIPKEVYLFENKNLFYNLYYPLKIRKIKKNQAEVLINNIINQFKLDKYNKKIKNLSESEKKIICLVRSLVRHPKYVLLENFYQNLDRQYHELAKNIINELEKNSIIIASEIDENISDIYFNYKKIYVSNGSVKEKKE